MRDPERIPVVMGLLQLIWQKQPDQRFHQLIHSLQWQYAERKDGYVETLYRKEERNLFTTYMADDHVDLFNVEDEDFIEFLKQKLEEE